FGTELLPQPGAYAPGHVLDRADDFGIIVRVDDDEHVLMVLRGRAEHRGAPDIDLLDRLLEGDAGLRDRLAERIEVDDHQVDRRDAVLRERGAVSGMGATGEQAAVHLGVQGLHAPVHHFGESRHLLDRNHGDPSLAQRLGGATGGYDLPAERDQLAGELHDAALVRNRQQRPGLHQVSATARMTSARLTTSFRSTTSAGEWE